MTVNGTFTDLDYVSSANIPRASPRFWAHLRSVYIVSAVALLVRSGCVCGLLVLLLREEKLAAWVSGGCRDATVCGCWLLLCR